MPAIPSFIMEPLWRQFVALIPPHIDTHPWGCQRPRIPDRIIFDKLVQTLVLGCSYLKIADSSCSATTEMDPARQVRIDAGIFTQLEDLCLEVYDQIIGLSLDEITIDGCLAKAPCGGEAAGKSPVDRRKQDTKRRCLWDTPRLRRGRREPQRLDPAGTHPGTPGPFRPRPGLRPTRAHHGAPGRRLRLAQDPRTTGHPGLRGAHLHQGHSLASRHPLGRRTHQLLTQPGLSQTADLYRTPHPRDRGLHRPGQRHHHPAPPHPAGLDHPPMEQTTRTTTLTYPRNLLADARIGECRGCGVGTNTDR